jgi:hypothetical protein
MGYKGGDLDLRTPSAGAGAGGLEASAVGGGAGARPLALSSMAPRSAPIWVDDVVMACSNQAFDLATAYRSGEVRIEHLLHAMTLVPAAAAWLEQQGVRVALLRRDTAATIAADTPAALPPEQDAPNRSAELEQVLRVAGQRAYARQRPAGLADLAAVLLDGKLEDRAAALFRQHAAGAALLNPGEPPQASGGRRRERVRVAAVSQHAGAAAPSQQAHLPAGGSEAEQSGFSGGAEPEVWSAPDRALAVLERTALVRGSYETEVAISVEGLRAIESFDRKFSAVEDALNAVIERLAGVEREFQGQAAREAGETDLISAHLAAVEQALAALPAGAYLREMDAKFEALESRSNDVATSVALMDERLAAVETATWAHKGLSERLHAEVSGLSESVARQRGEIVAAITEPVLQSISAVDAAMSQRIAEGVGAVSRISDRLMQVETALRSELEALSSSLGRRDQELAAAVGSPILDRIGSLESTLAQRHSDGVSALEALGERLAHIEAGFATLSRGSPESEAKLASEIERVHGELGTINSNQKTIASSMDLWREATSQDLGSINGRLEVLERLSARTAQFIEALVLSVQDLHHLATKAEERRNRLGKWLFGMDDAFTPSWKPGRISGPKTLPRTADDGGDEGEPSRMSLGGALRRLRKAIGSR